MFKIFQHSLKAIPGFLSNTANITSGLVESYVAWQHKSARARDLKFVDFLIKDTVTRIWRRDALNDLYRKVTYVCMHAHMKHRPTNEQSNVKNVCLKSVIKIIKRTLSMNSCNLHSEHKVLMLHILLWRIIWKERKQFASHCTYSFPPASIVIRDDKKSFHRNLEWENSKEFKGGKKRWKSAVE